MNGLSLHYEQEAVALAADSKFAAAQVYATLAQAAAVAELHDAVEAMRAVAEREQGFVHVSTVGR